MISKEEFDKLITLIYELSIMNHPKFNKPNYLYYNKNININMMLKFDFRLICVAHPGYIFFSFFENNENKYFNYRIGSQEDRDTFYKHI